MNLKIKILQEIINTITKDYGEDLFVSSALKLLNTEGLNELDIQKILYGVISFYFVDEITPQPVEKMNFIDPGSYYYRSESNNIDFPSELHKKYNIGSFHIDREISIFYSSIKFIKNYLKRIPAESLRSIGLVVDKESDLKMPSSRQLFLTEYFLLYPELFFSFFNEKYNSKFRDSRAFQNRKDLGYDKFLNSRLLQNDSDINANINNKLSPLINNDNLEYIITASGTAANQLVIEFLDKDHFNSFYHKYWYYENLDGKVSHYFNEIKEKEVEYDNFFLCLRPTNFVDIDNPGFIEDVTENLNILINKLEKNKKKYNIILDVTTNPFFEIKIKSENINLIRTMSLSKYQEGLNTNFAGLVIAGKNDILKMKEISDNLGFAIDLIDKRFLYLPDLQLYKQRIKKIEEFNNIHLDDYEGWKVLPVGLSIVLIPNKETINLHLKKFSCQTKIKDREFAWILRDRINMLIRKSNLKNISVGDSFLFPDCRINTQGQSINANEYGENDFKFKYRLPRISIGYNSELGEIDKYYKFYKDIIDIYKEEYNKL